MSPAPIVIYFDLNEISNIESYNPINPSKYGGIVVPRALLKTNPNFYVAARKECFEGMPKEFIKQCITLTEEEIQYIRAGKPILHVAGIPYDLLKSADIVFHHFNNLWINTEGLKAEELTWGVGYREAIHKNRKFICLYNEFQHPIIQSPETKAIKIVIGKPLDITKVKTKEEQSKCDYIFSCARNFPDFNTANVARFCLDSGIKGYFAGPIQQGYNLLEYIDNKTTFYLGLISEEKKMEMAKNARLGILLSAWYSPMNLFSHECLSVGTPFACRDIGFWGSLIKQDFNGFFINSNEDLENAWEKSKYIDPMNCYNSVTQFSEIKMLKSLDKAFEIVLNNKKT